ADHRVLAGPDRSPPVPADPLPHLLHAGDPVRLAEELPGLGDPQPRRVAEEAAADQLVVRVVGLEEERLARARTRHPGAPPGCQKLPSVTPGRSARNRYQLPSVTPTYARTPVIVHRQPPRPPGIPPSPRNPQTADE